MTAIPVKRLGRSGLVVSRLALGTMNFGAATDEAEAKRIVASAVEHGINHIDTADTYAGGRSEEITGRAIAGDRHRWVLATKLANPNAPGPNGRGLSRKWIMQEVQTSLKRLGTDFIDILYLHKEDAGTPLEETVRAIADLQRSGIIRYFGVSNFKAWRIARICAICDDMGIDRPVVDQPLYHALNRSIEVEVLPACSALGIGVFVYSPMARGVLAAKYEIGKAPPPAAAPPNRRSAWPKPSIVWGLAPQSTRGRLGLGRQRTEPGAGGGAEPPRRAARPAPGSSELAEGRGFEPHRPLERSCGIAATAQDRGTAKPKRKTLGRVRPRQRGRGCRAGRGGTSPGCPAV